MTWRNRWVVLVPGDATWLEKRTREILEEEDDGGEHNFIVVPGQGRYHAIVEKEGVNDIGQQMLLGNLLSRECEEAVYAIEGTDEWQYITRFLKGEETYEGQEAKSLVRSLGCVMPWNDEPVKPLKRSARTVVLIRDLSKDRVLRVLEKEAGQPLPPGCYRMEETPHGLLLGDGLWSVTAEGIDVAKRYPRATVFSITARPDLERFHVHVMRGRRTEELSHPLADSSFFTIIDEVVGERTPERILAALGIPKDWFRLPEESPGEAK